MLLGVLAPSAPMTLPPHSHDRLLRAHSKACSRVVQLQESLNGETSTRVCCVCFESHRVAAPVATSPTLLLGSHGDGTASASNSADADNDSDSDAASCTSQSVDGDSDGVDGATTGGAGASTKHQPHTSLLLTLPTTLLLHVAAMLEPKDALALRTASRVMCTTLSSHEADAMVWAPAVAARAKTLSR